MSIARKAYRAAGWLCALVSRLAQLVAGLQGLRHILGHASAVVWSALYCAESEHGAASSTRLGSLDDAERAPRDEATGGVASSEAEASSARGMVRDPGRVLEDSEDSEYWRHMPEGSVGSSTQIHSTHP